MHFAVHVVSQHTPSTQSALVHTFAAAQDAPFAFFAAHFPGVVARSHHSLAAHALSVAHVATPTHAAHALSVDAAPSGAIAARAAHRILGLLPEEPCLVGHAGGDASAAHEDPPVGERRDAVRVPYLESIW